MSSAPQPPPARPPLLSQPWRTAVFLMFAGALNYADRSVFSAVMARVQTDLSLSNALLGWIGSLFLWSYALGSPFAGYAGDRFPRRTLVTLSLVAWSLVTLLTGFTRTAVDLAILRVALGIAECLYIPTAVALLSEEHASATRGRAIAIAIVGIQLGSTIGGTVGGWMADHYHWQAGFWLLGGAGLVLAGFARPVLGTGQVPSQSAPRPERIPFREPFRHLMGNRMYLLLLCATGLGSIGTWAFITWLPLFFRERYELSLMQSGFFGTFVVAAPAIVGAAVGGWLSDRATKTDPRHRMLIMVYSSLLVALCMWGFLAELSFAWLFVLIAFMGILGSLGGVNLIPLMCDAVPPPYHATAQGLMNTLALAGGGFGVVLVGLLKSRVGLEVLFAGRSLLTLLIVGLYAYAYVVWLRRELAPAPRPTIV